MPSNELTFFHGTTFDGHPWVLSFEGGPTATNPSACRVSGRVGPSIRVRHLTAQQGSELRSLLPHLNLPEVREELVAL